MPEDKKIEMMKDNNILTDGGITNLEIPGMGF